MHDTEIFKNSLRLFNEKAEKLNRLSFTKTMCSTQTGVTISGKTVGDGKFEISQERRGPDEEPIDAFLLTFRFFIQDNEKSSFRNLHRYYQTASIESSFKNKFTKIRKRINDFLDDKSDMPIEFNGEILTRRKIMDTFIYGGLGHSNDLKKKKLYDDWMNIPPMRVFIENEFVYILVQILKEINLTKELNQQILSQIRQTIS